MQLAGPAKLIAIAGGSGSGKTTLARGLAESLGRERVLVLSQDSYYHDQSARFDQDGGAVNFDHPSAIDFALLAIHLNALKSGESVEVPVYDFATHSRLPSSSVVDWKPVVLVDGTLILSQLELCMLFDLKVFLDVPEDVRFERRLKRDVVERGREEGGVRRQFELQVAPMHDEFVQPSSAHADWVIPHGESLEKWILKLSKELNE